MSEFFKFVIDCILRTIIMEMPLIAFVCIGTDLVWPMYLIFIIDAFIMEFWKNNF